MISFTKRYVNIVSFLISIIVFILLSNINLNYNQININPFTISKIFKRSSVIVELNSSSIN